MVLIETPSFKLATTIKGDESSERLALLLPGRLDTKDYINFEKHLEYLADQGFLAVSFDPPGTWESKGDISLFTTTNYIKAVNELIAYFGNKPTLLFGHSRGGATAILAGIENQFVTHIVAVMATYGAPSSPSEEDIRMGVHVTYRDLPPGDTKTKEQRRFELPLNYFVDGQQYDVITALKNCTKPKLLIYGSRDEFTEPAKVKDVFAYIPKPKFIQEIDVTHDYRYFPLAIEKVNEALGLFLLSTKKPDLDSASLQN